MKKKIKIKEEILEFEVFPLEIINKNIENVFYGNKKTLRYLLDKAKRDKKNRLYRIASLHYEKYVEYLDFKLGEFILELKLKGINEYKLYLNNYGDNKYCEFKINNFQDDKGLYCYIVEDEIKYIGRSKKNFKQRFKDYGKITPYNCLIDGQATNCNINSKINLLDKVYVGFYVMSNKSDIEIEKLEKSILKEIDFEWNIQKS